MSAQPTVNPQVAALGDLVKVRGQLYKVTDIIADDRAELEGKFPNVARTFPGQQRSLTVTKPRGLRYLTMDVFDNGYVSVVAAW